MNMSGYIKYSSMINCPFSKKTCTRKTIKTYGMRNVDLDDAQE